MKSDATTFGEICAVILLVVLIVILGGWVIAWGYNEVQMYKLFGGQHMDFWQGFFVAALITWASA